MGCLSRRNTYKNGECAVFSIGQRKIKHISHQDLHNRIRNDIVQKNDKVLQIKLQTLQ